MARPNRINLREELLRFIERGGGSVHASQTYEPLAQFFRLTPEDLALSVQGGTEGSKWPNDIRWAREDLVKEGLIHREDPLGRDGYWTLTKPKEQIENLLSQISDDLTDEKLFDPINASDARDIILRAIVQRRGQQTFRNRLLVEYNNRCAITGECCVEVLEAAHIVPYKGIETNSLQNGIILRADLHTLLDLCLIKIDAQYRVVVSPKLKETSYAAFDGREVNLPTNAGNRPSQAALEEHRKLCPF